MTRATHFELHFDPEGDVLAGARECEGDVFLQTYGNTDDEWEQEYGPYESSSVFLALSEPGGDVVACARLILPSVVGLKSLRDIARPPWSTDGVRSARAVGMNLAQTWDIATIAVRKQLIRSTPLAAAALYHGVAMSTRVNNARWLVMIMDLRARRLLSSLNLETHIMPGTRPGPYLGSAASVPLWADAVQMADALRRANPEGYRLITQGVGLDGITVPGPEAFVLRDRLRVAASGLDILETA